MLAGESDKELVLRRCHRVTVPTTAQPATPPPGPYDTTIKGAAAAAAMIDKAGAGVKLVPVEFTLAGVAVTMMAPEGATAKKAEAEVQVRGGSKFSLNIKPGRCNLPGAEKYWLADREAPTASFVIVIDNLVLRTLRVKRDGIWKTQPAFVANATLGHVDVRMFDRGDEAFSQDDCLLTLRCAKTLALKPGYQPPKDLDALKSCGVMATRTAASSPSAPTRTSRTRHAVPGAIRRGCRGA